ncbi:MAG: hypothetical protein WAV41_03175 [Microgenomates group bacterium]
MTWIKTGEIVVTTVISDAEAKRRGIPVTYRGESTSDMSDNAGHTGNELRNQGSLGVGTFIDVHHQGGRANRKAENAVIDRTGTTTRNPKDDNIETDDQFLRFTGKKS